MKFNPNLSHDTLQHLFDVTMGFNVYHGGYANPNDTNDSAIKWIQKGSTVKMIIDPGGIVDTFQCANFMAYTPKLKPNNNDTLRKFFFESACSHVLADTDSVPDRWKIFKDTSAGSSYPDSAILWNNENPKGTAMYNGTWRGDPTRFYKVAVMLRVDSIPADLTKDVITIFVSLNRWNLDTSFSIMIDTLHVPYSMFSSADTDVAIFSSNSFHFPVELYSPYSDPSYTYWNDIKLELHSRRWTGSSIAWVAIGDTNAFDMMRLKRLNLSDPTSTDKYDSVKKWINAEADTEAHHLGSNLLYWYGYDEPQTAEFFSTAEVDNILNTHNSAYLGETERGLYQERRYDAIVNETHFNQPSYRTGDWGTTSAYAPYLSYGPGNGSIVKFDSTADSARHINNPDTSTNNVYSTATARRYGFYGAGYFPVIHGDTVSAHQYALDDTGYAVRPGTAVSDTVNSEYSFDLFDYSSWSNSPMHSHPLHLGLFHVAAQIDSIVYLDTTQNHPREWWANMGMNGDLQFDSTRNSTGTHYDSSGGYYTGPIPAIPEQLSLASNAALALGAKGLFFWWGVSDFSDFGQIQTGFTDRDGKCDTDWTVYAGNRLPTMYKRNCRWADIYSKFLKSSASQLMNKRWVGAFIRHMQAPAWGYVVLDMDSLGINSILAAGRSDSSTRPILKTWPTDSTRHSVVKQGDTTFVRQTVMPDSLCWMLYGFFDDPDTANQHFVYAVNLFADPRDLLCRWIDNIDSAKASVKRGERTVHTRLALDSTIARYWTIQMIDSNDVAADSILHVTGVILTHNAMLQAHYEPGGAHIFRLTPFCDSADVNPIDTLGVAYNNAVHIEKRSDEAIIVYTKDSSIYLHKMTDCAVGPEQLVDTGGPRGMFYTASTLCGVPYYLMDYPPLGLMFDSLRFVNDRSPAIARHRGTHNDEDIIVWEQNIEDFVIPSEGPAYLRINKYILGRTISFTGDTFLLSHPFVIADSLPRSLAVWTTPTVVGTDSGWVVAYSDSSHYIHVVVIQGSNGSYIHSQGVCKVSADTSHGLALYPSIGWGTDELEGVAAFAPAVHLVWQQDSGTAGHTDIWHRVLEVHFDSSGICPKITLVDTLPFEMVSYRNDKWNCGNTMPSISVDNLNHFHHVGDLMNHSHVMWHSFIRNDSLAYGRVSYREWLGKPKILGDVKGYASGVENFLEPNVFISPADSTDSTLIMTWFGSKDTIWTHYPGETILHRSRALGLHPTLSFSDDLDFIPSTVFETTGSPIHAGVLRTPRPTNTTPASNLSRVVMSVAVDARHGAYLAGTCAMFGMFTGLGTGTSTLPVDLLKPIPFGTPFYGNGIQENQVVRTNCFDLTFGVPLTIERELDAKDTMVLHNLLSTGVHPEELIELVDSMTGAVLKVLDSVLINYATDTVVREGVLTFYPTGDIVGFPVYVRARILADSNVAVWNVNSQFTYDADTAISLFAKQIMNYEGRAGMVPVADNPIDLLFYPTPANPRTRIMYSVPVDDADAVTEVRVYSIFGDDVSTLVNEVKPSGRYAYEFNGADLPTGAYVVAVHCGGHMQSKLIHVIR